MDLVTLVTACALGVEPKLMHALVWQQSGGEPWAVSLPSEPMRRVYSSMQQAISETRAASAATGIVRVGLAGLPVAPSKASPAMSAAQGRSDALCCGRVPRFVGTARPQIRGSSDGHGCKRRRAEL